MRWDYKDPARGDSFEYWNFWDTLRQMPDLQTEMFPFDEVEANLGREGMNRALLRRVSELVPDLVFFFFFTDEFDPGTVDEISKRTVTVNWFADDQWRFGGYSRHWAPHLTWVATTDRRAYHGYRRLGSRNVILTQWACNHFRYRPVNTPRDLDVTFIGQPHGDRRETIGRLRSEGFDVRTWGYGWDEGRLTQDQMIEVFSRSKINLNLSNASRTIDPRAVLSMFLERRGWFVVARWGHIRRNFAEFRAKRRDQIKGRNFEIPGCRTFLLTSHIDDLADHFELGKEIETFRDSEDLARKVRHYLESEEDREAVAQAGYDRTLRDHTYEIRFRKMFERMGLA